MTNREGELRLENTLWLEVLPDTLGEALPAENSGIKPYVRSEMASALDALANAGYKQGGLYVPQSNDGGQWITKNLVEPSESALMRKAPAREQIESVRMNTAVDFVPIKPFKKGEHFIKATGTTENLGGTTHYVSMNLTHSRGHYGINNGVLAFVDENDDYWVSLVSAQAIAALTNAGYQAGNTYVPHSNDGGHWITKNFPKPHGLATHKQ